MDIAAWRSGAAGLLLAMAASGASASVVLNLGTDGRARSFKGSVCGTLAAPVFQFGESIGMGGSLITGSGRCNLNGGRIATEYFFLPANARNIVLRVGDFETIGYGVLRLNTTPIRGTAGNDDGCAGHPDCDDRDGEQGGRMTTGFLPGSNNVIEIAFGGLRPAGLMNGGGLGLASLEATLTYDTDIIGSTIGSSGNGGSGGATPNIAGGGPSVSRDATTPEPGTLALLAPGLVVMTALWWWRRRNGHSLFRRTAMRRSGVYRS